MVIGLFPDCDSAEVALSNFSEIEVSMRDVSAIGMNDSDIDALSTLGPLTGTFSNHAKEMLADNMTQEEWQLCENVLQKGGILLAISDKHVPSEVIEEMLQDYKADSISIPEVL